MIIYNVHENDDGAGSPFVGYYSTKLEATRVLREAIKNRFEGEQTELEESIESGDDHYTDDHILDHMREGLGGRPRKIQEGEIRKLEIKGKGGIVKALNDAINQGIITAGGMDG